MQNRWSRFAALWLFLTLQFVTMLPTSSIAQDDEKPNIRKDLLPHQLPKNVATSFHRRAVDSTQKPWQSVGRVNISGTVHCSGTLIAPDIALTAAHCLFSPKLGKRVNPEAIHFLAGYAKGSFLAHARVTAYIVSPGFDGALGPSPKNLPYDWALLHLSEPLGDTLGFISVHSNLMNIPEVQSGTRARVSLPTTQITTAGYPKDRAHILSLEEDCHVRSVFNRGHVIMTDCIAIQGDSGGPILQKEKDKWVIIGTQTGATMIKNTHMSIGVSALAFRDHLIALRSVEEPALD